MSLPENLGRLSSALTSDASLNIGVGVTPSGSFKLEVGTTSKFTGVATFGSTLSNGTYSYTLPSATGTIALTSDLSSYLPLAGGTLTGALTGTSVTLSGNIIFDTTDRGIVSNTSDGSDNKFVSINGGGARGSDRGGTINLFGNEAAGTGRIDVNAGDVVGGVINLVTAGLNRLTVDRAGLVGIGTTSPSALLNTYSATTATQIIVTGADTTNQRLEVTDGTVTNRFGIFGRTNGDAGVVGTQTNHALVFNTNATERMRITSGGETLFNTTNNSSTAGNGFKILTGGEIPAVVTAASTDGGRTSYTLYSTGAGAFRFYVGAGGTVFATNTSISAISDISLKTNIRNLDKGLDEIMKLKPRRFDWKNGDNDNVMGFIAQEVEEIFPELIGEYMYNETESKKSLKMGDLLPSLVKAIQEQQAQIEELKLLIK